MPLRTTAGNPVLPNRDHNMTFLPARGLSLSSSLLVDHATWTTVPCQAKPHRHPWCELNAVTNRHARNRLIKPLANVWVLSFLPPPPRCIPLAPAAFSVISYPSRPCNCLNSCINTSAKAAYSAAQVPLAVYSVLSCAAMAARIYSQPQGTNNALSHQRSRSLNNLLRYLLSKTQF